MVLRSKRSIMIMAVLLVLAMAATAFAAGSRYTTTTPTFGHKTAHTGTKTTNNTTWGISLDSSSEQSITGWVDDDGSPATNDFTLNPGNSKTYSWGKGVPAKQSALALRIKVRGVGGKAITGLINYEGSV